MDLDIDLCSERQESAPLIPIDRTSHKRITGLLREYGFAPFASAIRPGWLASMRAEAHARLAASVLAEQSKGLCYKASITGLGPAALDFLNHPKVVSLLNIYFGGGHSLSEEISCLTFYDETCHLGAHLDEPAEKCSVTIIVYLEATSPDPTAEDSGLVLNVYGEDKGSIKSPRLRIPTEAGTIVLGHGSRVWHARPRLKSNESVIAITGCYKTVGDA